MFYRKLRGAMTERGILQSDLAAELGLPQQSISNRMTNRTPWTIAEAYTVLRVLRLPVDTVGQYFPPEGIAEGDAK